MDAAMTRTALIAVLPFVFPAHAATERLFYEITVTAPGTRSQGWHGTLYDPDGHAVVVEPDDVRQTNAGDFVGVVCAQAWTPCGFIHSDMLRWMQTNPGNVIMDRKPWVYRLYVGAECTRSEGWRGELLHGGRVVRPKTKRIATPFGPFAWKVSVHLWGQTGWFHKVWPGPSPAPHNWPC